MESPNVNVSAEMDFSFLNLDDCSREDRDLISNILRGENDRPAFEAQNTVPQVTNVPTKIPIAPKFVEVPASAPELDNFPQQQQQQQLGMPGNNGELPPVQQHHQQQQHQQQQQQLQMYEFPMPSATMADYSSTLTTSTAPPQTSGHGFPQSPYVFINNVTANVNVHHGPAAHMQDEQQQLQQQQQQQHHHHLQQQHQQQQQMMQHQRYQQQGQQQMHHQGPPPMAGHQGPPPPALLPTPQFSTHPSGYIAPFGAGQPNMGMTKAGHQTAMFPLPPMYPYISFPMPPYGYHGQMMPAPMSQVPQQQALPRAPVTMIRSQVPMNAGTIFTPPPPLVSMTIPDMTSFPGPPPVPVSVAPILNGSQVEMQQQQPQTEVVRQTLSQQQHQEHVELQMEDEEDHQFNEVKPEFEDFGFEVPDEIEVEREQPQEVVVDEKFEEEDVVGRADVPTPVQDEINVDEDEQDQQQQQISPPKVIQNKSSFLNENFILFRVLLINHYN